MRKNLTTRATFLFRPLAFQVDGEVIPVELDTLPGDLTSFVGDVTVKPDRVGALERAATSAEIDLFKERHPSWYADQFSALEFTFSWSAQTVQRRTAELETQFGKKVEDATIARHFGTLGNSIAQRFVVLLNLAIVACCSSRFCIISSPGLVFDEGAACHSWIEIALDAEDTRSLPPLGTVPCDSVFEWALTADGFWSGVPKTNVQRSLAYLTYIFREDFDGDPLRDIVWAMGALDAFYCESSVGISEKLKSRVPLIVADIDSKKMKKILNELYDDRSRVFHGDVSFVANFYDPFMETEESNSYFELFGSVGNLLYLLVRSIRYAIEANATAVDFKTTIRTRPA